jgi:hypothetical protein
MSKRKYDTPDGRPSTRGLSEVEVRDIIEEMLGHAFRQQARNLEGHLGDIHRRLTLVEDKTAKTK